MSDIGAVGIGAAGAGAAAFAFGGTAVPVMFGLFAIPVAAPIAVVAGAAVLGGGALFGMKRALFDGTYTEGKKAELIRQMEDELRKTKARERQDKVSKEDKKKFHLFLEEPIRYDLMTPKEAQKLMELVETGKLDISEAYRTVLDMLAELKALPIA